MSMIIKVMCDGDDCHEREHLDIQLQDSELDLTAFKEYMYDFFGWSFGEHQDSYGSKAMFCRECTKKYSEAEDAREASTDNTSI